MQQFEKDYAELILKILNHGVDKEGRNGITRSIFGEQLKIDMSNGLFPLIQGRKMYPKGVLGEFAAMVRKPTCLADFERWGCNYWKDWAKPDGSIEIDYGNAWFEGGQIDHLKECLANNPNDRRMIINAWRPDRLELLDLPCCHYCYQFYVENNRLHMIWIQRSVDTMIGLPSDIILAATWLITLAHEFGMSLGVITMQLGDCHLYKEHIDSLAVADYTRNVLANPLGITKGVDYGYSAPLGTDFCSFGPDMLALDYSEHYESIKLELKA